MIVDCHSHIWNYPNHISKEFADDLQRAWGSNEKLLRAGPDSHFAAMADVDRAIVFGLQAPAAGCVVPNEAVARYAAEHDERLVGFASVDPNNPKAEFELRKCVKKLGLKGLKLGPTYQHFDVTSKKARRIFTLAERFELPIVIHQGTTFVRNAPLKFANPVQLEDVALHFPDLRIVVAHLGHPWEDETAVLVRKQPNVFTDISAVHPRIYRLYNKLQTFAEYGVLNKIVFGSDFPFFTPAETMRGLSGVNEFAEAHSLPTLPQEAIDSIIRRNYENVFGALFN